MHPIYQTMTKSTGEESVTYRRSRFFSRFYLHWFVLCFIVSLFISFFISLEFYSYSEQESSRKILYRSFLLKQIFSQHLQGKKDFYTIRQDYDFMRSLTQAYEFSPDLSLIDLFYTQGLDAYHSILSHKYGKDPSTDYAIPSHWVSASRLSLYNKTGYWTWRHNGLFVVGVSLSIDTDHGREAQFVFVWKHHEPAIFSYLFLIEVVTSIIITLLLSFPGLYFILPSPAEVDEKRRFLGAKNLDNARRRLRSAQTKLLHLEVE